MTKATFLHGDCLEVLPTLPKGSAQMVFCDLPYGAIAQKWDVKLCLDSLWPMLFRLCDGMFLFTATMPFSLDVMLSNRKMLKYDLVWDKKISAAFTCGKHRPLPAHESILVFSKAATYNPQKTLREKAFCQKSLKGQLSSTLKSIKKTNGTYTHRFPTSVLRFEGYDANRGIHPTLKPVALLRWLIRSYSNPGDTILDPTAGSGTTAVAALLEGRHSICIEKDPDIYANAKERVLAVQRSLTPKGSR